MPDDAVIGVIGPDADAAEVSEVLSAPRLALRPKEAAEALGISERLLWSKTNAGEVPHRRVGRRVIYLVDELRRWLAELPQEAER